MSRNLFCKKNLILDEIEIDVERSSILQHLHYEHVAKLDNYLQVSIISLARSRMEMNFIPKKKNKISHC